MASGPDRPGAVDRHSLPYGPLSATVAANLGMRHLGSRLVSREIVRAHSQMLLLGHMRVDERLAAFLAASQRVSGTRTA